MASDEDKAAVLALPGDEDDDDEDDLRFSKDYRPSEEGIVLSAKEADFRTFLCDSGAAMEIVRLMVGLAETPERPENPVAFLRAKFDTQELPEMIMGRKREDIPALLELNASLHSRVAQLSEELDAAHTQIAANEAEAAAPLLQQLADASDFASDVTEGALDVAKLYAAVSARFPPPAEPAEGEEPPPPQPWAAEGALAPAGTVTLDALAAWAKAAFGYGAELVGTHGAELTVALAVSAAVAAEEPPELDEAKATGLFAAYCLLVDFTAEANAPAAEE